LAATFADPDTDNKSVMVLRPRLALVCLAGMGGAVASVVLALSGGSTAARPRGVSRSRAAAGRSCHTNMRRVREHALRALGPVRHAGRRDADPPPFPQRRRRADDRVREEPFGRGAAIFLIGANGRGQCELTPFARSIYSPQ